MVGRCGGWRGCGSIGDARQQGAVVVGGERVGDGSSNGDAWGTGGEGGGAVEKRGGGLDW